MDKRRLLESIKEAKEIFDNHLLNKNFLYVYKNTINEKEEPKKIGKNFSRVLCIMEKSLDEKQYNIIKYKVKDMEIEEILNNIKSEKIF